MKTTFIGHRRLYIDVSERLDDALLSAADGGCREFVVGTHGEFDRLVLSRLRALRERRPDILIEAVLTSLHTIDAARTFVPYSDVRTVMYDIEDVHYKRRITESNKQMIDDCQTLICYVDETRRGGATAALDYARRKGLTIINLRRNDDDPFFGMTNEEIERKRRAFLDDGK